MKAVEAVKDTISGFERFGVLQLSTLVITTKVYGILKL